MTSGVLEIVRSLVLTCLLQFLLGIFFKIEDNRKIIGKTEDTQWLPKY
jgi:hypothetical protein